METIHSLDESERRILLTLARQSIEQAVGKKPRPILGLEQYSAKLRQDGASFVTLTKQGSLRGCIGALEAYQPLVQDVCEHAAAAALEDYRFQPVALAEVSALEIEISVLTQPLPLPYHRPEELLTLLKPGVDGVILRDGYRRATFLPQVWEQIPDIETFLSHLCQKMGQSSQTWKTKKLEVLTYRVEEFHE